MEQKICVFQDVFNEIAARAQAEEKKTSAFGTFASLKLWDRPKDQDITLAATEKRYEPFWHVKATRHVVYKKKTVYKITRSDGNAVSVLLLDKEWPLPPGKQLELPALEHCESTTTLSEYFDGLKRKDSDLKLVEMVNKHPCEALENSDAPEFVMPELTAATVIQQVKHRLMLPIDAGDILEDTLEVASLTLFYRPVYAFEFGWRDKRGIVEIDGLTGKLTRDGNMLRSMVRKLGTRDALFDFGSDIAGMVVPGGNMVVKAVNRLTKD